MRTKINLPKWVNYAETAGQIVEPTVAEIASGSNIGSTFPARKFNWILRTLGLLSGCAIASRVGAIGLYPYSGAQWAAIKWSYRENIWYAMPNTVSGNIYWSVDGTVWHAGASYDFGSETVYPGAMDLITASNCVVVGLTTTSPLTTAFAIDPQNPSNTFYTRTTTSMGGPVYAIHTPKHYGSQGYVLAAATTYFVGYVGLYVDEPAPISGMNGIVGNRITHYTEHNYYCLATRPAGQCLLHFLNVDPFTVTEIYNFTTDLSTGFIPTCIDIDDDTGRIVIAGHETDGATTVLRILYSDDLGISWTDAAVPEVDLFVASPTALTKSKIQHLGGSIWVARMIFTGSTTTVPMTTFYSIDGGITWKYGSIKGLFGTITTATILDFDFNGEYWFGVDDSAGYMPRSDPLLLAVDWE